MARTRMQQALFVDPQLIIAALYALLGLIHAGLAGWALTRPPQPGSAARTLAVGAGVNVLINLLLAAVSVGRVPWLSAGLQTHLALYGAVAYTGLLYLVKRPIFRHAASRRQWLWLVAAGLFVLALLDNGLMTNTVVVALRPGYALDRNGFLVLGLTALWATVAGRAVLLTWRTYRHTPQPLHRNRLAYWALAWALVAVGTALLVVGVTFAGQVVLAGAAGIATLTGLRAHLPDARRSVFQGVVTGVVLVLTVAAYAALLWWLLNPSDNRLGLIPFAAAALVATLMVLTLNPLLRALEGWLRLRVAGRRYDPRQLVGEYGLSISNILETERLAQMALGLMRDAIGLKQAAFFVVDHSEVTQGALHAHLERIGSLSDDGPTAGTMLEDSPLAQYWRTEFGPLTQYEIDIDPRFAALSTAERVWLGQLGMDVYVPVYASREWIGLFALGPKLSRHRYFDEDLELLSTLADQTAVALRNARLVEDLRRLNADLKTSNNALDEASRRLAQLDRTKSEFINVISHELRTPLAILYGYAQILTEEMGKAGKPEHVQIVEGMSTGVNRLNEVIENMLDMARIDSRALQLAAQPVRIEHVIQKLVWQLQWTLADRQLSLTASGLEGLPAIHGDPEALFKAMHHLVINAVKYTPNGGTITISGRHAPQALKGGALEVTVSDTGIGIDPRFLELIFDKFYQAADSTQHSSGKTKFKGGGPGLGLAIARGIVEAHGGRLHAESAGHDETRLLGSRFIIVLPVSKDYNLSYPEN